MLGKLARDRTSVLDSILPRYAKDMADASQLEGVEFFLLSGICGPRLAAIHQCAESQEVNPVWTPLPQITQLCGLCCPEEYILFFSRLCPSTAGSSPPPESSIFLCPLLSLSILLPAAPQCHLSNDVLVFRLILHPLSSTLCF